MNPNPPDRADATTQTALLTESGYAADMLQLVGFHVGGEEFCLDIHRVQEIIRFQNLTRVPNSPAFIEGVMNLRGKIVPVVDLRKWFGLEEAVPGKDSRIVVVEAKSAILGFVVDSVSEVLRIPSSVIELLPRIGSGDREYVAGVAKVGERLFIVLNVDRLISDAEEHAAAELVQNQRTGIA